MACQIDGQATVGKLAARSGIDLPDAVERVTRLVRTGLCTIDGGTASRYEDQRPPDHDITPLPRRVRDTALGSISMAARPDLGLLKRIMDGLNALD
jgi:hypothetical protein